jgi:hypothetical protein
MLTLWSLLAYAGTGAMAVVVAGVVARQRYRVWFFFPLFLAVSLACTVMMLVWPAEFYTPDFWQGKENALNLLRFAMALELAYRTFRAFPGALTTLRWVLLLVLGATLLAVIAVSGAGSSDIQSFMADLQPRVLNGTIWLFTAIAALILWYRLPVDAFHKAVLLGYVPFLLVFTVSLNAWAALAAWTAAGWQKAWYVTNGYQIAYLALMVHWARAAWRRVEEPTRPPGVQTTLREPVSA